MNTTLEIRILNAKVSALTNLVNELAMLPHPPVDVTVAVRDHIDKLMSEVQYAGADEIQAWDRMGQP